MASKHNSKKSKPTQRRQARKLVTQALYQWHFTKPSNDSVNQQFSTIINSKNFDKEYFNDLLDGTLNNLDKIDATIEPFLDRKLKDLDLVELAILRYATYELLFRPDIPTKVIINEALEVTKIFGSVDGFKYVNGILDQVGKAVRQ